jgi:uncharacterized protein
MTLRSALYVGSVMHRRARPKPHRLRYRVFWFLFDLDELEVLPGCLRLFSHNRFNALSLHDADHGDGSSTSLREQVDRHLQAAGIDIARGPIRLLCMPRIFGYAFNPLSVYFCYTPDERLSAVLYEVHNTFHQRHIYLIPVEPGAAPIIAQECRKDFYVSPFMDMDLTYAFRLSGPDDAVSVKVDVKDKTGRVLTAALAGKRAVLNDAELIRALATHPALTLKVIAAIHWHALLMLLKGFKLRRRPLPPRKLVTVVPVERAAS